MLSVTIFLHLFLSMNARDSVLTSSIVTYVPYVYLQAGSSPEAEWLDAVQKEMLLAAEHTRRDRVEQSGSASSSWEAVASRAGHAPTMVTYDML